ncbi:ATP-binding protein [Aeromicrobium sp.]|uniref:sensor histidine kinase n=1 Tax=Aeromicrobium sp. TaxID=1871063 RepID=UPI003C5B2AC4
MIAGLHRLVRLFTHRMTLALRVAVLTTLAVAATLSVVSATVFVVVRAEFKSSLDESMLRRAHTAVQGDYPARIIRGESEDELAVADVKLAVVRGGALRPDTNLRSDGGFVDYHELEVAIGEQTHSMRTTHIGGTPYRVVAVQAGPGTALVMAQSMESIEQALERLKLILLLASFSGVVIAGLAGWGVATNGLRPVRRLTAATEHVARTAELTPIQVTGHDELARLTTSFNAMLQALDASQERQRQLVADAGHELRTPLTSLRTNIELIGQAADTTERSLSDDQRHEIMGDVRSQLEELTTLVGDLVELARDEPMRRDPEPLDFADVVNQAVSRVRLRAPQVTFDVDLQPWMVFGEPQLLERAVTNLLDNAAKWSYEGGAVRVRLGQGALTVSDEGPGIDPRDLPHIFDRFYRSREARTLPGSGLGLSIVKRAAERHGGTVDVASGPDGGTTFTVTLPDSHPS